MAVSCPNRNRGKRTIPPLTAKVPGHANCRGRLVVSLTVGVTLPLKSARDERPETMLSKYVLRYGVRVTPADLVAATRSRATCDVRCDSCGYSRRALLCATSLRPRKG